MAKRPCGKPGCGELVDKGYCVEHQKQAPQQQLDRWRGTSHSRGYDRAWSRVRGMALKRDEHLCVLCRLRNLLIPATEVHHEIPVAVWAAGRLLMRNLMSLCHQCHECETQKEKRVTPEGWASKILKASTPPQTRL